MLTQLLKNVGCSLLSLLRAERVLEARLRLMDAAVVLNLHQITPRPNPYWPGLLPEHFEELVRFAAERFEVVTVEELARPRPPHERQRVRMVFSFDDGYHDFVEYAAPILFRHRLRANQNVITGCVQTGRPTWNALMYDFLVAAPPALLAEVKLPGFDRPCPRTADERLAFGLALSAHLKNRPRSERVTAIAPLEAAMARLDFPTTRMMSVTEVKEMAQVHEIGSHSHSHESMGRESEQFFADDLRESRRFFAEELALPFHIYAFPNGSHRPGQVQHLLAEGVQHVLLVGEQLAPEGAHPVLPRITLSSSSAPEARLRSLGLHPRGVASLPVGRAA